MIFWSNGSFKLSFIVFGKTLHQNKIGDSMWPTQRICTQTCHIFQIGEFFVILKIYTSL